MMRIARAYDTPGHAIRSSKRQIGITGNSTGNITFNGSGSLAWTGWLTSQGHVYMKVPLADDGNGLHFNSNGHVYLNDTSNIHTGGTYFKNTGGTVRAFVANGGDGVFGPVPATPQNNIFAQGGNVTLLQTSASAPRSAQTVRY